jgi:phage baseplate assembly protein gpV
VADQNDGSIQIGVVQSVNYTSQGNTVTVLHEDAGIGGSVSTDIPVMRPKRPEIGDPVACIYLSNGQAFGICLGAFYQENAPADGIIEVWVFPNGDILKYDTNTNKFIMTVQNLEIQATSISLAGGGPAVARVGDSVTASGVDSHGDSVTVIGTITSGSSKVSSG